MVEPEFEYSRWFSSISMSDIPLVGGKNASLGEMYQQLAPQGVQVPNGFAVTTLAHQALLEQTDLIEQLNRELANVNLDKPDDLLKRARRCQEAVAEAGIPPQVEQEILCGFNDLVEQYGEAVTVAVRSSATAEDLPNLSFAGQHESFLNIASDGLLESCRRCYASLYTPRAIRYRISNAIEHSRVGLSIGIMKMVRADMGASGVTFTLDTDSGHRGVVYTTATYGLGENLVKGNVDPDEFYVHKDRLAHGYRQVMKRRLGPKQSKLIFAPEGIVEKKCTDDERQSYAIDDAEVLELADIAINIERHYSELSDCDQPMDIEWARDGLDRKLYILQARPETVASQRSDNILEHFKFAGPIASGNPVLLTGHAVGHQIASGLVRIVKSQADLEMFVAGEVLVAETTSPDWGAVMQNASAIITDRGGRTCHAAIVAREMGIPAIVGTGNASSLLKPGATVTIACHEGETGHIYAGQIDFVKSETRIDTLKSPHTKMMLNIGNPELALKAARLPNDGVGLARMEFIINNHVNLHPMAAQHPERVSVEDQNRIAVLTRHYSSPATYFVNKLAEGIAAIAGAFFPKTVIVRLSDFKSNEYAALLGGAEFEPDEENPMLGFRGAARYSHPDYQDGFALECQAIKRVREDMGFDNVKVMVPFCRRVEEGKRTLEEMQKNGLGRGETLQVFLMCEIPNNVISIDDFAKDFDGFSIGSNDLTQLTLGVDRDSELVAFDFDERDPGVMKMLKLAIEGAQRNGRRCGICGQAPSDYIEVAEFLVELGIDSMSLNPDALIPTAIRIAELEQKRAGADA